MQDTEDQSDRQNAEDQPDIQDKEDQVSSSVPEGTSSREKYWQWEQVTMKTEENLLTRIQELQEIAQELVGQEQTTRLMGVKVVHELVTKNWTKEKEEFVTFVNKHIQEIVTTYENQLSQVRKESQQLEKLLEFESIKLNTAQSTLEFEIKEKKLIVTQFDQYRNEILEQQDEINELKEQLEQKDQQIQKLSKENQEIKQQSDARALIHKRQNTFLAEVNSALKVKTEINKNQKEIIKRQERHLTNLEQEKEKYRQKHLQLERDIENTQKILLKKTKEVEEHKHELKKTKRRHEEELGTMKIEIEGLETEINELRMQLQATEYKRRQPRPRQRTQTPPRRISSRDRRTASEIRRDKFKVCINCHGTGHTHKICPKPKREGYCSYCLLEPCYDEPHECNIRRNGIPLKFPGQEHKRPRIN